MWSAISCAARCRALPLEVSGSASPPRRSSCDSSAPGATCADAACTVRTACRYPSGHASDSRPLRRLERLCSGSENPLLLAHHHHTRSRRALRIHTRSRAARCPRWRSVSANSIALAAAMAVAARDEGATVTPRRLREASSSCTGLSADRRAATSPRVCVDVAVAPTLARCLKSAAWSRRRAVRVVASRKTRAACSDASCRHQGGRCAEAGGAPASRSAAGALGR